MLTLLSKELQQRIQTLSSELHAITEQAKTTDPNYPHDMDLEYASKLGRTKTAPKSIQLKPIYPEASSVQDRLLTLIYRLENVHVTTTPKSYLALNLPRTINIFDPTNIQQNPWQHDFGRHHNPTIPTRIFLYVSDDQAGRDRRLGVLITQGETLPDAIGIIRTTQATSIHLKGQNLCITDGNGFIRLKAMTPANIAKLMENATPRPVTRIKAGSSENWLDANHGNGMPQNRAERQSYPMFRTTRQTNIVQIYTHRHAVIIDLGAMISLIK